MPDDPSQDIQFSNWEKGVEEWLKNNPGALNAVITSTPQQITSPTARTPEASVVIHEPKTGVFASSPLLVSATLSAHNDTLQQLQFLVNNELVGALDISGTEYHYQNLLRTTLAPQNKLEVRAITRGGITASASVVIYH